MNLPHKSKSLWTALLAGIVLWELLGRLLAMKTDLLPTPSRVVLEMYREWPRIGENALTTILEVAAGLASAAAVAVVLAVLLGACTRMSGTTLAVVSKVPAAPLIAFAPLFWIWFGSGMLAKVALAALVAFFPLFAAAIRGCAAAPEDLVDLGRLAGAGPGRIFRMVRLPCGLSVVIGGLRSAAPLAMSGALAAELVVTDNGLGYLLLTAASTMDLPLLCAILLVILALGFAFHGGITLAERSLLGRLLRVSTPLST